MLRGPGYLAPGRRRSTAHAPAAGQVVLCVCTTTTNHLIAEPTDTTGYPGMPGQPGWYGRRACRPNRSTCTIEASGGVCAAHCRSNGGRHERARTRANPRDTTRTNRYSNRSKHPPHRTTPDHAAPGNPTCRAAGQARRKQPRRCCGRGGPNRSCRGCRHAHDHARRCVR